MIRFFQRSYPSANSILVLGHRPILVDSGFGADADALMAWLAAQGVRPDKLSLVVNTHSHCDHAGGNHALRERFGVKVAASRIEAVPVNARDPDACRAEWLHQPIEPYTVGRMLEGGHTVGSGGSAWRVVATPGHTAGHISLHCAELGVLLLGDILHDTDVGWLNPYKEGADSLERAEDSIARLALLPARTGYSGHGPEITDLPAAFARARRRLQSWREDPQRIAWHACKRIFAHALMLSDGVDEAGLAPMLLACPWFRDHARLAFGLAPADFIPLLVAEMLRADAAFWQGGRLMPRAPYTKLAPFWPEAPARPALWPKLDQPGASAAR